MIREKTMTIVIIAVLGLAALGALALGASTQQQTCPPDVEVKWYALVSYLAYASGQSPSQLIAEAQASGNFTVEISGGVELTVPYCSLNATFPNGTRAFFAPAVGVGELKKLGLNVTQARAVFQRLQEARREALANLSRYLKPIEIMGLDEAALALSRDKGYREAAEANANASAVLRALADVLARSGVGGALVGEVLNASEAHREVASALRLIGEAGGLAGIRAGVAANLSAAIASDSGYLNASAAMEELAGRLDVLARAIAAVNSTVAGRLAHEARLLNSSASALALIGIQGGIRGIDANVAEDVVAALNGTYGIQDALARAELAVKALNATLALLRSVNASPVAVASVEAAVERHERALGVLRALEGAGGYAGVVDGIYGAVAGVQPLSPQIAMLCIDLNVTQLLAEYGKAGLANTSKLLLRYQTYCEVAKLLDWSRYVGKTHRGIYIPMQQIQAIVQSLRSYINSYGGKALLQNDALLRELLEYIISLERGAGLPTTAIGIGGSAAGSGGISIGGMSGSIGLGGNATGSVGISIGGSAGSMGGSGAGSGGMGGGRP